MRQKITAIIIFLSAILCLHVSAQEVKPGTINRKALVERHTIQVNKFDSLSSLSVGNGSFAFTVDITGLQSFPNEYAKGIPLGTQSEWGWHSFNNTEAYRFEEVLKKYRLNGRDVTYAVHTKQPERNKAAVDYFRQNPHRLQLGNIGLEIIKSDSSIATITDIQNIHQKLNLWTGEINSTFTVENIPVQVITYCHQQEDVIAVQIISPLVKAERLFIRARFSFPSNEWADMGNKWSNEDTHSSSIVYQKKNGTILQHTIDTTIYYTNFSWKTSARLRERSKHYFIITPQVANDSFEFSCRFAQIKTPVSVPLFNVTAKNNAKHWKIFWQSGGAIDFNGSTDIRAAELERRIVLSQYLTKIQCSGNYPPQETGLTYNSWYGKPHMEMLWWHAVHFALWGRTELLEKKLSWYVKAAATAKAIAKRQGYDGVRWQKMTDNDGRETPSSIGAFLIWQQPHLICFAELCYRDKKSKEILQRYKDLVFATADFMTSYAFYDSAKGKYILGKGVIAAQERYKPEETFNPAYELAYWHWGLTIAQQWRKRMHLPGNKKWNDVLQKLSPLPVQGDKYLFTESATDSYTNPKYSTDHPSVLGTYGMLPKTNIIDTGLMANTFNWIWDNWTWKETWGWDFPMTAMTATRLGLPGKAIEALLMNIQTNTYLNNGHNYQDGRLTIYLPGNGGLLAAIAMMCAGYDNNSKKNPGIPADGKWKVKWEGLKLMP